MNQLYPYTDFHQEKDWKIRNGLPKSYFDGTPMSAQQNEKSIQSNVNMFNYLNKQKFLMN